MSFYPHVHYAWVGQGVIWTPNTAQPPGPIPTGPARRLNTFASSAPYTNWHGFIAAPLGPVVPLVGDIITQGLGTALYVAQGYHVSVPAVFSGGDIITQGLGSLYLITQGFTGGGITVFPDPFSAVGTVLGVDPFSAVSSPGPLFVDVQSADYSVVAPAFGAINTPSDLFHVEMTHPPFIGTVTITPSGGGLSIPIVLTFTDQSPVESFSITPTQVGAVIMSATNSGGLVNVAPFIYSAISSAADIPRYPDPFSATSRLLGS